MLFKAKADELTIPQMDAWEGVKSRCLALEAAGEAGGDRMAFHGTSALRAASILEHGFVDGFALTGLPGARGTHWGTARWARWGAGKAREADDPPCILAARLADVVAAGTPRGDRVAWDLEGRPDDLDVPWHVTFEESGAFVMVGARWIPGLVVHGMGDLPLHPRAREVRARRLAGEHVNGAARVPAAPFDASTRFAADADVDLARCQAYRPGGRRRRR